MEEQTNDAKKKKNPPEVNFRDRGLNVSVWKKVNQFGTFRQVSISKNYKDQNTNEWKTTFNYVQSDLPQLVVLITQANKYLLDKMKEESLNENENWGD